MLMWLKPLGGLGRAYGHGLFVFVAGDVWVGRCC
jgi:hypothetical protein